MNAGPSQLDLASYRLQVRDLPRPTPEQILAFARFVMRAHSWYKRPLLRCTTPFVFFLDPTAGCNRMLASDGSWRILPRSQRGFHHNSIPTAQYQERYGHLCFAWGHTIDPDPEDDTDGLVAEGGFGATIVGAQGMRWRIPRTVEQETTVYLSGLIHPWANQPFGWTILRDAEPRPGVWPEESGGLPAFEAIQARCRALLADRSARVRREWSAEYEGGADAVLAELLAPERNRQRGRIVDAIGRLPELV